MDDTDLVAYHWVLEPGFSAELKTLEDTVMGKILNHYRSYQSHISSDSEKALYYLNKMEKAARDYNLWEIYFIVKFNKSSLYITYDNWPEARKALDSAWIDMETYGDSLDEEKFQEFTEKFQLNEATYYEALGNFARASRILNDLISDGSQSKIVNSAYSYKNRILKSMGNFQEADLNTRQWLKWERERNIEIPHRNNRSVIEKHLGDIQKGLGNYEDAKKQYKVALATNYLYQLEARRKKDNDYVKRYGNRIATTLDQMADLYYLMGATDSSLHWLRLSQYVKGSSVKELEIYPRLGQIFLGENQLDSSTHYFSLALKAIEKSFGPTSYRRAKVLAMMAKVQALQGQETLALKTYQEAANSLLESEAPEDPMVAPSYVLAYSPKDFLQILRLKTETLFHLYQKHKEVTYLTAAWEHFQTGQSLIDSLHTTHGNKGDKQFLVAESYPFFELGLNIANTLHGISAEPIYQESMFSILEKSKGIMMRNTVSQSHLEARIPPEFYEEERRLSQQLKDIHEELLGMQMAKKNSNGIREWKDSLLVVKAQSDRLVNTIRNQYPDYYRLKYDAKTLTLGQTKDELPGKETAVLSYFLGDSALYIICVSPKETRVFHSENAREVKLLAERYISRLRNPNNASHENLRNSELYRGFIQDGYRLYQLLLEPVDAKQYKKLTIIPDGILGLLSFESLVTNPDDLGRPPLYRDLPYLLNDCEVSYQQSATLAFETPAFRGKASRPYMGIAPSYGGNSKLKTVHLKPVFMDAMKKEWEGEFLSGAEAIEAVFKSEAAHYNVLHFHGHAESNSLAPLYSWLAFTSNSERNSLPIADANSNGAQSITLLGGEDADPKSDEDGYLFSYELYNLQLNANLVVLSACETGSGKVLRGEGVMSMAHAFRYAGCPNILMPLWEAENIVAQDLTLRFFQQLKKGSGKATALRAAKLDYLESGEKPHPFYWSSFVLMGDNEPVGQGRDSIWKWVLIGLGLVLIGVVLKNLSDPRKA